MLCAFQRNSGYNDQRCIKSYSDDMIKSQVIASLCNTSHQSMILIEISSLPTLYDLVKCLLTLEPTTRATNHFQPIEASSLSQIPPPFTLHTNRTSHLGNLYRITRGAMKFMLKNPRIVGILYIPEAISNVLHGGSHATSVLLYSLIKLYNGGRCQP